MRITHDTLMKIAGDAVARKVRSDGGLLGAYLQGSLLGDDYLLGGAADIDLVFIHMQPVSERREIVRLTDEVHLDIEHHHQRDYREPRSLRVHPWLGPTLNDCRVMYDPQHFLDFTQAGVRGQFDRADFVFERARKQAEQAREIWMSFQTGQDDPDPVDISNYFASLEYSANSVALLVGKPLPERRFLVKYLEYAEAVGRPGLFAGLMGLLGAPNLPANAIDEWLPAWQQAFESRAEAFQAEIHPDRRAYYHAGLQSLVRAGHAPMALWPLLRTWTLAVSRLAVDGVERRNWFEAMHQLGLSGAGFGERILALDAYLDTVDETLEAWARANGVWE